MEFRMETVWVRVTAVASEESSELKGFL
jgi:hypothetical protein